MTASRRILFGIGIAVAACVVAYLLASPVPGAVIGLLAGASAATLLAAGTRSAEEPAPAVEPPAPEPAGEWASEIVAALTEPALLLDGSRVAAANKAARALMGEWIEGRNVRLALRHPAAVEALSRAGASDTPERLELMGLGAPERRWLMTIAPLRDRWRLVQLTDRSEAAATEQVRVDFVANASHELRTPLATLLGFIETLRDDDTAGDRELRHRFLGIMNDEARRMQQLIEDLMSLSRIEAERFRPPRDPIALAPLVDDVRGACGHLLTQRRTTLSLDDRSAESVVAGDRTQLLQLLRNLVINAVKYGREGAEVTVRIEDESASMVRLTVIDRGEGIAPEHLPRLTERFYRVDAGRSRAVGGTGLGLAIVKHIVGRHRGRLEIRSRPGEGTEVQVSLPRFAPVETVGTAPAAGVISLSS